MKTRHEYQNLTWLDLESPTKEEMREVMSEFSFHPVVAEELLSPTIKPKVDVHDSFLYLILHFPPSKQANSNEKNQEVDFIVGKNFLITTRYDSIEAMHTFAKSLEANSTIFHENIGNHAGHLFYHLVRRLYKELANELETVELRLDAIEKEIFNGKEKTMVHELSKVSKILLDFKQSLAPHKDVLESFKRGALNIFGEDYNHYMNAIINKRNRIVALTSTLKETMNDLRETNNSLLSTKQNEVMKTLTIMAFVTFPLSLIASIFGMNTYYLPIVGGQNDFWIVILIMAILTFVFFVFFKYRKWL